MLRTTLFAVAAAAIALPALAAPAPSSAEYMMKAGQGDAYEVAAGKLAESKGSGEVKTFGAHMVTDHTKSTAMVMDAARKSGKAGPALPMSAAQKKMIADLQAAKGTAFNGLYVQQQRMAHQEALALHSSYSSGGDDANLKSAAAQIVPVVQMHIDMLAKM